MYFQICLSAFIMWWCGLLLTDIVNCTHTYYLLILVYPCHLLLHHVRAAQLVYFYSLYLINLFFDYIFLSNRLSVYTYCTYSEASCGGTKVGCHIFTSIHLLYKGKYLQNKFSAFYNVIVNIHTSVSCCGI